MKLILLITMIFILKVSSQTYTATTTTCTNTLWARTITSKDKCQSQLDNVNNNNGFTGDFVGENTYAHGCFVLARTNPTQMHLGFNSNVNNEEECNPGSDMGVWQMQYCICEQFTYCAHSDDSTVNTNKCICPKIVDGVSTDLKENPCVDGSYCNGVNGACRISECTSNFTTMNSIPGGANTISGNTISFECQPDYTPSGPATCQYGSWDSPTCDPNPCTTNFTTTKSIPGGANTISGNNFSFECQPGYEPTGIALCTAGSWSGAGRRRMMDGPPATSGPTCSPCGDNQISDGTTCETCASTPNKFEPNAAKNDCVGAKCGIFHGMAEDALTVANSNPTFAEQFDDDTGNHYANHGYSLNFNCATGYTPSGPATCQYGQWNSPRCDPNPCTTNFTTTNSIPGGANTISGNNFSFECQPGYEPTGNALCTAGSWSGAGSCERCGYGKYSSGTGACKSCPSGTLSKLGQSSCDYLKLNDLNKTQLRDVYNIKFPC